MSFEAVAWAMKQKIPVIPKFVLVALCERANPDTGECWPGIKKVANAVSLSERSVVTYIGALVRNGYVMRQPMRGKDGRKRTNHYWVIFDRPAAPWIGATKDELPPNEHEDEPHANPASGDDAEVHTQLDSCGPRATVCAPHIMLEPPELEPEETIQEDRAPIPPPQSFNSNKRARELQLIKAAEEARAKAACPVIEGSKPWREHVKAGHPPTLVGHIVVNGRRYRGWYFPTLYPKATGPPPHPLLTEADEEELANKWG